LWELAMPAIKPVCGSRPCRRLNLCVGAGHAGDSRPIFRKNPTSPRRHFINTCFMPFTTGPGSSALRKGRYSQENGLYFITSATDHRIPWFQEFSFARIMCSHLENRKLFQDSRCLCWVVMPDHIHLLLQVGKTPLFRIVNRLKSSSARALNQEIGRSGRFWDHGFHDYALRKEEDMLEVARYIVANPIRAGLTRRYGDYPYWNAVWI